MKVHIRRRIAIRACAGIYSERIFENYKQTYSTVLFKKPRSFEKQYSCTKNNGR